MPLSSKQQRIYDFIRRYLESNKEAPTIAEIGRQFQMRSSASVHQVLIVLEDAGMIEKVPNVARGIKLTEPSGSPVDAASLAAGI
jgi:repressor LexA